MRESFSVGHKRKGGLGAICAVVLAFGMGAMPAQGAPPEPDFVLVPPLPSPPAPPNTPPPTGTFNGPCGVAVDSTGRYYVSDYYHHAIDVFNGTSYVTQVANVDPLGGPCAVALDSSNRLFVNNYHRNITKYNASPSFGAGTIFPLPEEDTEHHLPTGVAVDPVSGNVYVNNRTYVSVYDATGVPVEEGGEPLKIGLGTLGDGYGLALSQYPATLGYLYVPDAATDTVKVYNAGVDEVNPVEELKDPFGKAFSSLRDSAIAVDRVTGEIYFADNTQPAHTEKPQAIVYVYRPNHTWRGYLKYRIVDALPPGLAVDNSFAATQGRVYVTSGNTHQAGVYAYPPGAATTANPQPPTFGLSVSTSGTGSGAVTSAVAKLDCAGACERDLLAGSEVALTASPDPGSNFNGWSGACAGPAPTCTVEMDRAASVRASFAPLPAPVAPGAAAAASGAAAPAPTVGRRGRRAVRHRRRGRHRRHRASRSRRARQRRQRIRRRQREARRHRIAQPRRNLERR